MAVAWHPTREELFVSADHNGELIFWMVNGGMLHKIDRAHNSMIWGVAWHPTGQILATSGNDHKVRYWGRCTPGKDAKPPVSMETMY